MYKLTSKSRKLLKESTPLRLKVATGMGVGENAITMSLRRNNGSSIANNFGAMEAFMSETGLSKDELVEVAKLKKAKA